MKKNTSSSNFYENKIDIVITGVTNNACMCFLTYVCAEVYAQDLSMDIFNISVRYIGTNYIYVNYINCRSYLKNDYDIGP